ncbi:MAG: 4-hydroxythreonine-4-phosphate dehydrogenase [bacterium]|nr:MAG: 4-hydroxythreonine-4-phosphate dehydrogenase [bacterium]
MKAAKFPKVLITAGDPHGIGPEVVLKGVHAKYYPNCLVVASKKVFVYYQKKLSLPCPIQYIKSIESIPDSFNPKALNVLDLAYDPPIHPGLLSQKAGDLTLRSLDTAIDMIRQGLSQVLITAPVNKEAVILCNPSFKGHTEYLAEAFNTPNVTMLMASETIKVALVTTHISLQKVSENLDEEQILRTIINSWQFLMDSGVKEGHIAVAALNPHAGEGGHFGNEEVLIQKAVIKAQRMGMSVTGPFPADTLFCEAQKKTYDLFVAMYHDQGLIPFKLLSFGKGLNLTLGLPFKRISVDHGTAFDIAGQGLANPESMTEALDLAFQINKEMKDSYYS